jgi:hypothetical protein
MLGLWVLWMVLILVVPLWMTYLGLEDLLGFLFLIWLVVLIVIAFLFRPYVAERHRNVLLSTPPAEQLLELNRPYIVYLRSFDDEQRILKRYRRAWPTEEEQIAAALNPYGVLIAIRNPGEDLPALGAARLNATADRWEEEVRHLVDDAAFVLLRLADSPGVLWELSFVTSRLPPSRIVLLSALTESAHGRAATMLEEEIDIRLPRHSKTPCAITFHEGRSSEVRLLRYWNLRGGTKETYLQVALVAALVPFLRRLGFEAKLPPLHPLKIVGVVFSLSALAVMCWGFLTFPWTVLSEPLGSPATMDAVFAGFLVFCLVAGLICGVLFIGLLAKRIEEIGFPEQFVNPWWKRLRERRRSRVPADL